MSKVISIKKPITLIELRTLVVSHQTLVAKWDSLIDGDPIPTVDPVGDDRVVVKLTLRLTPSNIIVRFRTIASVEGKPHSTAIATPP